MDRVIYLTMSGAKAAMQRQEVVSNNLANVSTTGFRAELATFRAVPVRGDGATTRVFALEATAGHLDAPGPVNPTGRPLDVAAKGGSWFTVQGLDGTEAYTRAGAFEVSPDGTLVSPQGLPVLTDGGAPITVPANAQVDVAADGTVSARVGGAAAQNLGRIKLVTPGADTPIARSEDGLFRPKDGQPLEADAQARVQSGALEGSNVNPILEITNLIEISRAYERVTRIVEQTGDLSRRSVERLGRSS